MGVPSVVYIVNKKLHVQKRELHVAEVSGEHGRNRPFSTTM